VGWADPSSRGVVPAVVCLSEIVQPTGGSCAMGVGVVKFSFPHFFHDPGRCLRQVLLGSVYVYYEKH
jgi:hypothetical protein